ncbi:TOTE conflict system archaeo-eukaryotic primase domain-containing protein [Kribbella catacumbae]|uniref:TOTE conflict system archaeo-eukaryotic primase domain-containing protein n=1 Tax=Kribbella catacumbae TaxID=460086 RepID=UPI003B50F82F
MPLPLPEHLRNPLPRYAPVGGVIHHRVHEPGVRPVPAALEVSRSGVGAHAWVFFTAPVPAETARRLGTALLREAMAVRGRMDLASYDRLFPSQDVLPAGGVGNLIAAPLHGKARQDGATAPRDCSPTSPVM